MNALKHLDQTENVAFQPFALIDLAALNAAAHLEHQEIHLFDVNDHYFLKIC